jgi:hypothetical protein
MGRTAKCTWQDYKTNEDNLSELKINPTVKTIQNYRNKWVQHSANGKRRLPHLIIKCHPHGKRSQG